MEPNLLLPQQLLPAKFRSVDCGKFIFQQESAWEYRKHYFLNTNTLQSSVVKKFRCGGIFNNLLLQIFC